MYYSLIDTDLCYCRSDLIIVRYSVGWLQVQTKRWTLVFFPLYTPTQSLIYNLPLIFFSILFYGYGNSACVHSVYHVYARSAKARRGHPIPVDRNFRNLCVIMWVLGINRPHPPLSSGTTVAALKLLCHLSSSTIYYCIAVILKTIKYLF